MYDFCARHRERLGGLAAQHLINEAGRNQLTDPEQADEARGHKVVVGQAMPGVGSDELVDAVRTLQRRFRSGKVPASLEKSTR